MTVPLLEAREVAELIGMRVDYIYELCRRGEIPCLTFGRTRRFRPEAIERWLAESETGPGAGYTSSVAQLSDGNSPR